MAISTPNTEGLPVELSSSRKGTRRTGSGLLAQVTEPSTALRIMFSAASTLDLPEAFEP